MTKYEANKLLECINELKRENAKLKREIGDIVTLLASEPWDGDTLPAVADMLENAGYDLGYRGEGEPTICGDSQEGHE